MLSNERGSVLLLTMMVITILLVMVTGFMNVINNEIKATSSYRDILQAGYIAGAGAEKALNVINNDPNQFPNLPTESNKQSLLGGKYWYDNPTTNNPDSDIYTVKVISQFNGIKEKIRVKILSNIFDKTTSAGGEIKIDPNKQQINGSIDSGNENLPNFDFEYYKRKAIGAGRYYDKNDTYYLSDIPPAGITYVDKNLSLDLDGRDVTASTVDTPAIIVVDGDLTIVHSNGSLKNVYFIVNGKFKTHNNNNNFSLINTFIYAEEGIDFNGNNLEKFSGGLMTPGDIDLTDIKGNGGVFNHSTIQTDALSVDEIKLISWKEI